MKFGPDFDWVRGGKLPGLCGARCLTGCKEVTGLDGFSSRQMWRPCVWPPEHEDNEIHCDGGKIVAYVYHMNKTHWCGDDFEYSNDLWSRIYSTNREPVVPKNFFQPQPDEWYTVWSHVKMNTAGKHLSCFLCCCRSFQCVHAHYNNQPFNFRATGRTRELEAGRCASNLDGRARLWTVPCC